MLNTKALNRLLCMEVFLKIELTWLFIFFEFSPRHESLLYFNSFAYNPLNYKT